MICDFCNLEMSDKKTASCLQEILLYPDDSELGTLPYFPVEADARCPDCGVSPGGFHHPGCDMERCPKCRGQMISCSCRNS